MEHQTYFDLLPTEILACITPHNYIYGYLYIFNPEKSFQVFRQYMSLRYPDYYPIYSKENIDKSYNQTMKELYDIIMKEEVDDFRDVINIIDDGVEENIVHRYFRWAYPIILSREYPKVVQYLKENPKIVQQYIRDQYGYPILEGYKMKNDFYYDLVLNLMKFSHNYQDILYWDIPENIKIKLIDLADLPLSMIWIDGETFDLLFDTELMKYLMEKGINIS